MVKIRFVEINGLYSYGNEKNRIDFGQKTVIVGTNDSGKSSVFKALNHFLKCLTELASVNLRPWDQQDVHEMTVGFVLNDSEKRYTADILSVIGTGRNEPFNLGPDKTVEWLASRLERVRLTIRWGDDQFLPGSEQTSYALCLEDLRIEVCSIGYNGTVWAQESLGLPPSSKSPVELFPDVVQNMLENGSADGELGTRLDRRGAQIFPFLAIARLVGTATSVSQRNRAESVIRMSGNRIPDGEHSFFIMFGHMLEQGFSFVSERRNFQESNNFEKLPLADDGGNLQSFLFWLQNGDKDRQDTYDIIQKMFEEVLGWQNLSFIVSAKEKKDTQDQDIDPPNVRVHLDKAIVRFVKTPGPIFTDFMSVGAGVRETLFLLAKCFERPDRIILLDEPATNIHPTQIRQMMNQIMIPDDHDVKSGQVIVITHSPVLASLKMLSAVNQIVRVDRQENSRIVQPTEVGRKWIKNNLATFHMLKSDILFAKKTVLVEGYSDRIFIEAVLNQDSGHGDDIAVVDVGGKCSFKKFRTFLEIFGIPFVILADDDAEKKFESDEVLMMNPESIPLADAGAVKTVYLLKGKLEGFLSRLNPELYREIKDKYETKNERTYNFTRRFFAGEGSENTQNAYLLECLKEWIMMDSGNAG